MSHARILVVAVLAAAAMACGSSGSSTSGPALRQPSAIAVFRGFSLAEPGAVRPYLAIANEARNDLALVNAIDDKIVNAPIQLRPLSVPVNDRPSLLVSAPLGDEGFPPAKADLLVAVSAGSSELQLIRTWAADNSVDAAQTVDLGDDVLALAALPSPVVGTVRIVAALAGEKLAVVDYARSGDAIVKGATIVHGLGFQPVAIATAPGDAAHVYAASLDPVGPGPVFGVAEIDVSAPAEPWPTRALGARAPTSLVAAALLRERGNSVATDRTAFDGQPLVTRVYAVLDEGSCGPTRPIDCGVVVLDPTLDTATRGHSIPADWAGWMPYRAPIRLPTRAQALAVSQPPIDPPSSDAGDAIYQDDFMRLFEGVAAKTTTAVGVIAGADGNLHFLDLGRFKVATATVPPTSVKATFAEPRYDSTDHNRLWIQDPSNGTFAETAAQAAELAGVTPGYTPTDGWTLTWQGLLPGLSFRAAEAGADLSSGNPWLAIQIADGPPVAGRILTAVARVFHPALGVKVGDIAVIKATRIPGCAGTLPPGAVADTPGEFEARIAAVLAPVADLHPGGALLLETPTAPQEWVDCFAALEAKIGAENGARNLVVDIRGQGLVLETGALGQAGRPNLGAEYVLEYPDPALGEADEDELLASCTLADWDGSLPAPACDDVCRTDCDRLVLARKARRLYHVAEDCGGDDACEARWTGFPIVNGPALRFQVGVEPEPGTANTTPRRGLSLQIVTASGVDTVRVDPGGASVHASGLITFDRSPYEAAGGYRFFVSYPSDMVVDASPSLSPNTPNVIR